MTGPLSTVHGRGSTPRRSKANRPRTISRSVRRILREFARRWHAQGDQARPGLLEASVYDWLLSEDEIRLLKRCGLWPFGPSIVRAIRRPKPQVGYFTSEQEAGE